MKKIESDNKLIKRNSSNFPKSVDSSNRAFQRYQEKKKNYIIESLTAQLTNLPQFLGELSNQKDMVLDISKEVAEKIANGELEFVRSKATDKAVGILRDSKSKNFFSQVPIKEVPLDLASSIATIGLTNQVQDISRKLDVLENKLNQVNRNFDLNRYAEVQSAIEKYRMALLSKNVDTKEMLLRDALSQATDAKNLLLNQLFETKEQLKSPNKKYNIPLINDGLSASESAKLAQVALDNLSYMKDAFGIQISTLAELKEYDVLDYTVAEFQTVVLENFSEEEALFLDGNLPISTNPFKYLSENVLESTETIIDFIQENDDLLNVEFFSKEKTIREEI